MTTKKMLRLQLERLLSSVGQHGNQHLSEIEADLLQTNFLLTEAIGKLSASFMAMHVAMRTQQEIAERVLRGEANKEQDAEGLAATAAEMEAQVNIAVTGLQFQDMTNQLIGRALQRIAGLSKVLDTLSSSSSEMAAHTGIEEIVALLGEVNHLLEQQSGQLESDLWRTVSQTHMGSGDIELF